MSTSDKDNIRRLIVRPLEGGKLGKAADFPFPKPETDDDAPQIDVSQDAEAS